MTYQLQRFDFAQGYAGQGNYFADQINQFLAINPTISPVSMSVNWRFGRSRSDSFYLNLCYRGGSGPVRSWCAQFQSTTSYTAEQRAAYFFSNNPTYLPLISVVVSRPGSITTSRRLLVIYATQEMSQVVCVPQNNIGAPVASVAMAAFGTMYDPTDFTRPGIPALNLGNAAWPAGGVNMLIRTNEGNPDVCAAAGIAPTCFTGSTFTTPPALSVTSLCGHCLPPDAITISTTSTTSTTTTGTSTTSTTSTTSSTSSTTSSTTSTSTSSSTTTASTTSTTTTSSSSTTTASTTSTSTTTTALGGPCTACGLGITQPAPTLSGSGYGPGGGCLVPTSPFGGGVYQNQGANACTWTWNNLAGNYYIQVFYNGSTYQVTLSANTGSPEYGPVTTGALSCIATVLTGSVTLTGQAPCAAYSVTINFG